MFEITLDQGHSLTTMLVVAAVAIALTAAFYYRAFRTLRAGRWQALLALRILAIVLVVLLLFKPLFRYEKELEEKPAVVFLLDTSSSMGIADDATGVTRFNQARDQVEKWWEKLRNDFELHLVEFSERARPLEAITDLAAIAPEGKATSLSRALVAATKQVARRDHATAILLSDGVHNSARNPLEVAGKMGMVVHTIGVGASLRSNAAYRDVQLTGIDCPDRLLLNNMVKIKGFIEGIGLAGRVVKAILEEDGRQVAEAELTLGTAAASQEVVFDYRPTTKGRHTYVVRVPPLPEEKITQNNQRSAVAMVIEPGIRVLYVEGTLRAEYGALVDRFLSKDPDLEFSSLVQTRPNVFLKRSNMEGLKLEVIPADAETINKFDVFILGDLDASYLRPAQQELFAKRIREGAGLLMLGGYHGLGPGGYAGTPLGEIMPVRLGNREIGQINDKFLPTLTPDGVRHPIFANINSFFPTQQQAEPKAAGLPLLDGCTRVEAARPGATVLAMLSGQAGSMPVMAVQPVERGRTAIFCGDTTRKWQQGPRAFDQESPYLRFWGQTIRWLAGRSAPVEASAGVVGNTDKGYYEPEEAVQISAVVRNQEGQAANDAVVTAKVKGPDNAADQVTLSIVAGPAGHYGGSFDPKLAGTYEIVVEAKLEQLVVSSDKLPIEVGRPDLEFEKLDLNEKLLGQIAADANGRYMHITAADHLIDQLDRTQRKKQIALERPLYNPPVFWMLLVTLLTTEWALRKKFQLR